MAEKVWLFGLVIAALVAVSMSSKRWLQTTAAWLAFLASVGLANWVGVTAHLGGTLVYAHGVGTPAPAADAMTQASASSTQPADPKAAFFRTEVAPILANNCFKCHNPARAGRSGKLDQTTREGMLKGGRSGPAIVPGKPEESMLIKRVRGVDPEEDVMPPDNPLPEETIKKLEKWIQDGAVWPDDVKPAATVPAASQGS
jgi:hypothetical protein